MRRKFSVKILHPPQAGKGFLTKFQRNFEKALYSSLMAKPTATAKEKPKSFKIGLSI